MSYRPETFRKDGQWLWDDATKFARWQRPATGHGEISCPMAIHIIDNNILSIFLTCLVSIAVPCNAVMINVSGTFCRTIPRTIEITPLICRICIMMVNSRATEVVKAHSTAVF